MRIGRPRHARRAEGPATQRAIRRLGVAQHVVGARHREREAEAAAAVREVGDESPRLGLLAVVPAHVDEQLPRLCRIAEASGAQGRRPGFGEHTDRRTVVEEGPFADVALRCGEQIAGCIQHADVWEPVHHAVRRGLVPEQDCQN